MAVQSLDQKALAAIADLRGRVARYAHRASVTICCKLSGVDCSKCERKQSFLQRICAVILVPGVMHSEFERLSAFLVDNLPVCVSVLKQSFIVCILSARLQKLLHLPLYDSIASDT